MKITAERKALADAVAWVAQVVPRNPNHPALGGIRMRTTDGYLTLSAFDYDVSHEARVAAEITDEGECLVGAGFLRSITGALTSRSIALALEGNALTIKADRSIYTAQTFALADYPTLPTAPAPVGSVDATLLADAITACHGPVDDEAPTEGFRGMRLEGSSTGLDIVGLDGRLLVHRVLEWDGGEFATTTPGQPLATAIGGLSGRVSIGVTERAVSVADADHTIILRTMGHEYAKWRKVPRPAEMDRFGVVVERDALIESVKRAALLTRSAKDAAMVTLTIELDSIEVTTSDSTAGGSEVVDAEGDGREVIPMSPQYLLQALGAMESGLVRLGIGTRRSADMAGFTTVRPANDTDDSREATFAARRGGAAR